MRSACILAALVFCGMVRASEPAVAIPVILSVPVDPGHKTSELLRLVAIDVDLVLGASRPILLGDRSPQDGSVTEITLHNFNGSKRLPLWPQDDDGGPGRKIAALYIGGQRGRSPREDFYWQQTHLKATLEIFRDQNRPVLAWSERLASRAAELLANLEQFSSWPEGLTPVEVEEPRHWPGYCLKALNDAVVKKDLSGARRWAAELAAATFAVSDLHRWLDFLMDNQLASLAFQAQCAELFVQYDAAYEGKYQALFHADRFPGGYLGLSLVSNYLEVERQAERLLSIPKDYVEASAGPAPDADDIWIPPHLRAAFVQIRDKLSPGGRLVLAQACRTPYERSYLVNMLFRAVRSQTVDRMASVLQRFDKVVPQSTVPQMMDVLFYRGGDGFGGFEWADRFDARLMAAAEKLSGNNEEVVEGARLMTFGLFSGWQNYEGFVITLREALNNRKLDCVRATDMIGSLYRDAGRPGFYNVRWTCGVEGHTVAAAEVRRDDRNEIVIVDGLESRPEGRCVWPESYLRGPRWPTGFPGPQSKVYAAELNGRGLDSYIWMEGCVLQGPNTGLLVRAGVPYVPGRDKAGMARIGGSAVPGASGITIQGTASALLQSTGQIQSFAPPQAVISVP